MATDESVMIFLSIKRLTRGLSMIRGVANKVSSTGPLPLGWSFTTMYIFKPPSKMVSQKATQCENSTEEALAELPMITLSNTGQDHIPNIAGTYKMFKQ